MTRGLSHVAMSVPPGTLAENYRRAVLDFYGPLFGWHEIESLRLADRLTIAIGDACYINLRERPEAMTCHGYEHFGVFVESAQRADELYDELRPPERQMHVEPMSRGEDGFRSFRFQHLLPLAVEVQFFP